MALRPSDPWPRGAGHVVYAWPGTGESDKGYEEPGGSFSPAVGSFGISFWVVEADGKLLCTSDSIPVDKLNQRLVRVPGRPLPDLVAETPYYTARWSLLGPGRYELHLHPAPGVRIVTAVRSVGPAGGPIRSIRRQARNLTIDGRWNLRLAAPVNLRAIGHEGDDGWTTKANSATEWQGSDGWGYALLTAAPGVDQAVTVEISGAVRPSQLRIGSASPALQVQLPDLRFNASLNAQTAHLMMGLVDKQTRPGDPTNYPLPWLRDGAYVVVALARAGQIDVAKQLLLYFADHDFFGGFGPEADAPGLSLWAIGEVSAMANDRAFDASLWPAVERKVRFIQRMRDTTTPIYEEPFGPIVPAHAREAELNLVAEPGRDGLIVGRMDWGRPLLFVNAVSYAGLTEAAGIAGRLGHRQEAKEWKREASSIQAAWERALPTRENQNERTYVSTMWPTWVGANSIDTFTPLLEQRWQSLHDSSGAFTASPIWTYFDVADAHQWLLLGRQDRVWRTLSWFLDHQSATGLYTWGEGTGEENNFGRWKDVRGWIDPKCVTPHYWTAAEMLLLQLDMLAYVDRARTSTVVLGAGIPAEWLKSNMEVRGLQTELGRVDWSWRGGRLTAVVHHGHPRIVAGGAFGRGTPVTVTYANR